MKKTFWIIIILAVVLIGAVVVRQAKLTSDDNSSIKIGADFALTGFGASWAENQLKGAALAIKEINANGGVLGKSLELVVEDNKSESKGAVTAAMKLISLNKVHFLLTGWTDQTEPIIPIINQNKIVTMNVAPGASDLTKKSPYLFRTWPADKIAVKALVDYAVAKGYKKAAVVRSVGAWEETLSVSFVGFATDQGIRVSDPVSVQIDTQDFKTIIAKLKSERPDLVFIPITSGPVERFVKQAYELGFDTPLFFPVDVLAIGLPDKVSPRGLKNFVYATYAASKESFVRVFEKEYGMKPGVSADTTYDAVYMLAGAIEKAGKTDSDSVIVSFSPFDGASGRIVFDESRDRMGAEVILMGFDGVSVSPVERK